MNARKSLIKLARKLENSWQNVDWTAGSIEINKGWYICEFLLPSTCLLTPRIVITDTQGRESQRELTGFHSGRNRMLIYLPEGQLSAYSKSIEFKQLARVSSVEGRVRVLLICFRYLLDFFSLRVLLRMFFMQFQHPLELSTTLLNFYQAPSSHNYLSGIQGWQRYRGFGRILSWPYRQIKIAVVIEDDAQRRELLDSFVPPDLVLLADQVGQVPAGIDYVIPLSESEHLRFPAIFLLKRAIAKNKTKLDLVYTDHDYQYDQSVGQKLMVPVFKPKPSLAYLYCFNYIGPSLLFSRSVVASIKPNELLSDEVRYRLALKCMHRLESILHVDEVLFVSERQELLQTPGPDVEASCWRDIQWQRSGKHNRLRVDESAVPTDSVDLIIPTRDGLDVLRPCIDSILNKTDYPDYHIYIADNDSQLDETKVYLQKLESDPRISVVPYPGEFNFSAINNFAVSQGSSKYVGLINNDIEVIDADWLSQMMVWAKQDSVGIVGAKLLFGNGKVQHAGVTIGMGNAAGHIHRLEEGDASGYQNRCIATQNMMAVTAACLVTPRDLYERLGGLDEQSFAVAYNDIDYCLKVDQLGHDIIWTPEAKLYHHESVSRGDDLSEQHIERYFKELTNFQKRWKTKGFVDKYYSRHLRIGDEAVYPQVTGTEQDELYLVASKK